MNIKRWRVFVSKILSISLILLAGSLAAGGSYVGIHSAPDTANARVAAPNNEAVSWRASAPGRVEPISGTTVITSEITGRLTKILVKPHERVAAGAVLAELGSVEQLARVASARAEVAFRISERNNSVVGGQNTERQTAQDDVQAAMELKRQARIKLDAVQANFRSGGATQDQLKAAQKEFKQAGENLASENAALKVLEAIEGGSHISRSELALNIARADLEIAQSQLEKTKIRAPYSGEILHVLKTVGEIASATDSEGVFIMGDTSKLRVRAEVSARDIPFLRVGQQARIKTYWDNARDITGHISFIAAGLRPKSILTGTPGAPSNTYAAVVFVEIDRAEGLLPGMRVDVFFSNLKKRDENAKISSR